MLTNTKLSGIIIFPSLWQFPCGYSPGSCLPQLLLWGTAGLYSACCPPGPFQQGCFSQPADSSLYWALGLFNPRCRTLHFSWTSDIILLAQYSSLSRCLRKVFLMCPIYPNQWSWWGCKSSVSRSFMEVLSNVGHSINLWDLWLWQAASQSENRWWSLLSMTQEPVPYLFCIPLAWAVSPQFVQEQAVVNYVQYLVEVQPDNTHCSLCIDRKCCLVGGDQISQVWLAFINLCRLSPVICLV